jgi:hypothetical protein
LRARAESGRHDRPSLQTSPDSAERESE